MGAPTSGFCATLALSASSGEGDGREALCRGLVKSTGPSTSIPWEQRLDRSMCPCPVAWQRARSLSDW